MIWTAPQCGCTFTAYIGAKRPRHCQHGNLYKSENEAPKKRSGLKRGQPKRDWSAARAKVTEEGCCRICKRSDRPLEAAHILGREHDEPKVRVDAKTGELVGTKVLWVEPVRIVPACGPFPDGCHGDIDMRRINLLPYLTLEEQIRAVEDSGGIAPAYMRLAPVSHREEVEASAACESPVQQEAAA